MDASATHDPADLIAVVGMAGRFPDARDTDRLWELLIGRGDAIRPIPPEPGTPRHPSTRSGRSRPSAG